MSKRNLFWSDRSGAVAVEFVLIAPIFIALLMGIIAFGTIISAQNGLQQIVADAARASIAGISDTERDQLARGVVTTEIGSYPFLDPLRLAVATDQPTPTAFRVSVTYDMSSLVAYHLLAWMPLPPPVVKRSAVVQRGGF